MHRSRLYGVFVDAPAPLAEAGQAVDFWAGALGVPPIPGGEGDPFTVLPGAIAKIGRAEDLIATYREHISIHRQRADIYHHLLGRIGERLGEPEPGEPL